MDNVLKIRKAVEENLSSVRHKILVMSGKGGVGKSSFAVNMAVGLTLRGKRVGILDTDVHGPDVLLLLGVESEPLFTDAMGKIMPVKVNERLSVLSLASNLNPDEAVVWRGPLKISAIRQFLADTNWGELDFLIIDSPPGTGDEPLTVMQFLQGMLDGAVVITTPQDVALLDTRRSIAFAKKMNVRLLGIVENMSGFVCPHCGKTTELFLSRGADRISRELGVDVLGHIPFSMAMVRAAQEGRTIWDTQDDLDVIEVYNKIIDRVLERIG